MRIAIRYLVVLAGAIAALPLGLLLGLAFTTPITLIGRRARRPIRTFRIVALVALVVSILPNLSLMANPAGAPFPGATSQGFGLLIVFHVVAAVAAVATLTTLARR